MIGFCGPELGVQTGRLVACTTTPDITIVMISTDFNSDLLLEQCNSAFSIPLSNKVVTVPVSFFVVSNACYKKSEVLLTSINFSEQMIIDASSAPGPDRIQASFWKKCTIEIAVPLQMLFIQSLESGIIPECLKRAAIVPIY